MKAFISYSSGDRETVRRLAEDLRARGVLVWLDEWEIRVGDEIRQKIEHGIKTYDYFVIVLSARSVNSTWVAKELNAAYMKEVNADRIVVLPALIEKCEIPILISGKKYANFTESYEEGLSDLLQVLAPSSPIIPRKTEAKILIVDDDLSFAEDVAHAFKSAGWSSARTYDLDAAAELTRRYHPDCALIDLWCLRPGEGHDQSAALDRLRNASPRTKVFGYGGYIAQLPEEVLKSLDGVFVKPFSIDAITKELIKFIGTGPRDLAHDPTRHGENERGNSETEGPRSGA